MNQVILIGHLTKDVEIKYTKSGTAVATSSIAVNHNYTDQTGGKKKSVMFIDITAFGRLAEIMNQYQRKGSKLAVTGRLDLQTWVDREGNNRQTHKVILDKMEMLDSAPKKSPKKSPKSPVEYPALDINDDEIPF